LINSGNTLFVAISNEANKFDVSLSAMAIRLTQLAYDNIAIYWTKDGTIKWSIKSSDFQFDLISGIISPNSVCYDLLSEKKNQIKTSTVMADCWIEKPIIDKVFEESVYFPTYNSVLSIVHYNPDDVEIYDERRI
jgi:hypothetical protein